MSGKNVALYAVVYKGMLQANVGNYIIGSKPSAQNSKKKIRIPNKYFFDRIYIFQCVIGINKA